LFPLKKIDIGALEIFGANWIISLMRKGKVAKMQHVLS
jgi:hypothetical protein